MTATDKFLNFFFNHQLMLIEVLFALILGVCAIWLFAYLQKENSNPVSSSHDKKKTKSEEVVVDAVTGETLGGAKPTTSPNLSAKPLTPTGLGAPGPTMPKPLVAPLTPLTGVAASAAPTPTPITPLTPAATTSIPSTFGAAGGAVSATTGNQTQIATASATATVAGGAAASTGPVKSTGTDTVLQGASGSVPNQTSGGTNLSSSEVELNKLKSDIEEKAKKLETLQAALDEAKKAATASGPNVNVSEYEKKIQDLESRLGEYEIIEDDIANLSLYKEENVRLKNELEKIKKGGGPATPSVKEQSKAAPEVDVEEEDEIEGPNLDAPAPIQAQAVPTPPQEKTPPAAEPPATNPSPAAPNDADGGDKLIEEFESFMKGAGR